MPRATALFGTKGGRGVPEDSLTVKFIIGSEILAVRSPWFLPNCLAKVLHVNFTLYKIE